ncbi:MAG TPA: TIM barrel protein [Candidatus Latescibacteria bacterium]|nr:TIM barrel protein [Candidatus Latescibacterota bacterium]HOS65876.1 TIM barrel protein [Candidatus Latescibacterota bacterium]HPK75726.1 TIM barrel protein [Candidatus Latescibacterota bacterium]
MALDQTTLSIVHFMAFPGPGNTNSVSRSEADPAYLLGSIRTVLSDPYFGGIEITHIKSHEDRRAVADLIREMRPNGMEITFACQPVQLINEENLIAPSDISSVDDNEREKAVARILSLLEEAAEVGATKLTLLSGRDPAYGIEDAKQAAEIREMGRVGIVRSLDTICRVAKPLGITIVLEIFDNREEADGPKAFKGQFIGPTPDAVRLAENIRYERNYQNFGLLYDSSHMVLMQETPEALKALKPYLAHVHVANCVTSRTAKDADQRYGDRHPKFGAAGSAVDSTVLAEFVQALVEIDYRGTIGFEVAPIGSESPTDVIATAKAFFDEARNSVNVAYARPSGYAFRSHRFFPEAALARVNEIRVEQPELVEELLSVRPRREKLTPDGRLTILAADHPARNVTQVGDDPVAMGNRLDYLGRIMRVLVASEIDGLMATSDVIDDVVLADYVLQECGKPSVLEKRLLIASMNRTGLAGAEYEMMDKMSSYRSAKRIAQMNLDGAKLLLRISAPDKYDRYVLQTMDWCAEAIEQCNDLKLPVFLEPLPVERTETGYRTIKQPDPMIRVIGVAQALSHSTARTWLKIPYTAEFDRVAKATTLPLLLLGGEATARPWLTVEEFVRGLGAGANVRGALVGRNVLFPGDEDPAVVAQAIHSVVHEHADAVSAMNAARERRGSMMDFFAL